MTRPVPEHGLRGALAASRNIIVWAVVFSAGLNLLYLAPSLFMLQVYDRVLTTGGMTTLGLLTAVLTFALVVLALLDMTRNRLAARLGLRLNRILSPTIIELESNPSTGPGHLNRGQAARDFDAMRQAFLSPAAMALLDAPWTLVFVGACFLIHPLIGILTLIGGIVLLAIAFRHEHALAPAVAEGLELSTRYYSAQEADRSVAEATRALGMRPALAARQLQRREAVVGAQARASFTQSAYGSLSRFWRLLLQSLVLAAGAYLAVQQLISPGALIAGSILASRALSPLDQIVGGWRQLVQARLSYRRLVDMIDKAPPQPQRTVLPAPRGALSFERVGVRFHGSVRPAVHSLTFALEPGEMLAVVGHSGAGKSTLARLAVGIVTPDLGFVRLDGASLLDWDPDALGRHIGYLPQDVSLTTGTVAENIRRFDPASPDADARAIAAARTAGAHDLILHLPKAYDTELGPRGRGLSLGQAQRIALARALYGDPALIVLDEPNAHLDVDGEAALVAALSDAKARGATILAIVHRPTVVAIADRVMVLREGGIEMVGPRDEVARRLMRDGGSATGSTPLRAS
ncbi:MAG: type I secretion system permease/ATPase [Hyphomonadaceae bacterium]|nr:type I secretion system permease/ATPase [Hyphomonadaceae bacterium]